MMETDPELLALQEEIKELMKKKMNVISNPI
jgi:hypothetical protein